MILHGYWRSGAAYRVRIALALKGLNYDQQGVDLRTGAQRSEAFVALNLVAKPAADETLRELGTAARHFGDHLLALLIDNQMRDCERSRRWSAAVVEFCADGGDNKAVINGWIDKWMPLATKAIADYCAVLPESDGIADAALGRVRAYHRSLATSI